MRPKKRVLLVECDEDLMARRRYLLVTKGFAVIAATTSAEAIALFRVMGAEIVIAALGMSEIDGNELIRRLKLIDGSVPMILTSSSVRAGQSAHQADAFFGWGVAPAELIERMRIMTQRKRGPKKRPVAAVLPDVMQERVG